MKEINTFEGPIHDVKWSPNGELFITISGYMPAGAVLYGKDGTQKYLLSEEHLNSISWSDNNKLVILGGFGNLNG